MSRSNNTKNKKTNQRGKKPNVNRMMTMLLRAYGPKVSYDSYQPRWMRVKMKYCEQFTTSLIAGAVVDQIFRANSAFDPDRTNIGHQPRGHDQMLAMYNRYRVIHLKWHVEFGGATLSYNICVAIVNGAQVYTTIVDIGETNLKSTLKTSTAAGATVKFSGAADLSKVNGRSEIAYNTDDTTGALTSTNPVETVDLHVVLQNINLSTIAVNYTVTLTYDCIYYDQILPGQS